MNLDDGHLVGEPGEEVTAAGKKARLVLVTQSLDFTGARRLRGAGSLRGVPSPEPGQGIAVVLQEVTCRRLHSASLNVVLLLTASPLHLLRRSRHAWPAMQWAAQAVRPRCAPCQLSRPHEGHIAPETLKIKTP